MNGNIEHDNKVDEKIITLENGSEYLEQDYKDHKSISITTWYLSNEDEQAIDMLLDIILATAQKEELKSCLYSVVKELTINATKANMKAIFFQENHWVIDNQSDYEIGIVRFKESFSEDFAQQYGNTSKEQGKYVKIFFVYNSSCLSIEVVNNTPITTIDKERIYEKLALVSQYDDLIQFYMDHVDQTEGEGMGFALISILLKGVGIPPDNLSIQIDHDYTTAKLTIPFREPSGFHMAN